MFHTTFSRFACKESVMSITITPVGKTKFLAVTGEIEQTLAIPAHPDDVDYVISVSDGTLLAGSVGDDQRHALRVAIEGAAIVRHSNDGGVMIDWPVEWLTIAPASASILPERQPTYLPLFPQCLAA
jgi:hypothetical protein